MTSAWKKIKSLFARSRREAEIDEELAFHLDRESEDRQEEGLSFEEAQYAARRDLGNLARVKEDAGAAWRFDLLETILQDVRVAVRSLKRNPAFGVVAILILGLGIGASTSVFSVVNAVMIRPLAFRDPDRIVALSSFWKKDGGYGQVSVPDFNDWRAASRSFDSMAYYGGTELAVAIESGPLFAAVTRVSPEFFRVFGVNPAFGRLFEQQELTPAGGAAVVSHSFWQSRFGGDPSTLGKTIRFAGIIFPIVGVMPPGFGFPNRTEVWVPWIPSVAPNRGGHNWLAVGRLADGVTLEGAQSEMRQIGDRLEQAYPGTNGDKNVAVVPLAEDLVRSVTTMLRLLLGSVFLLLLISCGNVANLLLARAATRTRELGLRSALGAARKRIVRQLATESLVLGIASGLVGVAVAGIGTPLLVGLAPGNIPRLQETGVDGTVLGFAVILTMAACLLFGLIPAFRASRVDVNDALKQTGSRSVEGVGSALRRGLVIAEIALSFVLLTGAGLLIRSFFELSRVELGFETRQILVMETSNPTPNVEEALRTIRNYRRLLDEMRSVPGIVAFGAARVPPGRVVSSGAYEVDGAIAGGLSVKSRQAVYSIVSPGAFEVLGIGVRQGRDFSTADGPDAPLTAIINETLARSAFPGQDPVGHQISAGMDRNEPMTIVGVVGDIHQLGPGRESMAEIYMPYEQHPLPSTAMHLLARTSVPPENVMDVLRRKAKEIAPDMPIKFTTMEARTAETVAAPRFRTLLMAIFAGLAVALSIGGTYGVVSFLVNQRTQEIGVRMALGASAAEVLKMVLSQGIRMAAIGLAAGVAGAAGTVRFLDSMLFEVRPFDAATYALVAALIALVTTGACFVPARRASRIDPMLALRHE
jgi:putative ABC transport system permease protein